MATACRWPPDSRRTRDFTEGTLMASVDTMSTAALRMDAPVQQLQRSETAGHLAGQEQVLPDGEVLDQGQVLVHGLDAGLAGLLRVGEAYG